MGWLLITFIVQLTALENFHVHFNKSTQYFYSYIYFITQFKVLKENCLKIKYVLTIKTPMQIKIIKHSLITNQPVVLHKPPIT